MKKNLCRFTVLAVVLATHAASSFAEPRSKSSEDWPFWRGPTRDGKAAEGQDVVTRWSEAENILWKVSVPGRGHASPTVIGSHILLATADAEKATQQVVAFDRASGKQRWEQVVNTGGLPEKIHGKNTHASGTVASDGDHAFAIFYNRKRIQVVALDVKTGEVVWDTTAGDFYPQKYEFGYGASPMISGGEVIVAADYEKGGFLVALDRKTGRPVWQTKREAMTNYATPVLETVGGKQVILISGNEKIDAYSPATGALVWSAPGPASATCGTVVTDGERVFASGGFPQKFTIGADATGAELWRNNQKAYEQSMLIHKGFLFSLTDSGIAYCWRAKDGEEMWRQRLKGPVSASPVLVGELIYQSNELGTTFVFMAQPAGFELVAENQLGDESFATLAVCGNRIFTRVSENRDGVRQEWLYCIGQ